MDAYRSTLSKESFFRLSELIEKDYGIKMPETKRLMLESRLRKRLVKLQFCSFEDYCDYIFTDEGRREELVHMVDHVTTNKTDFFREPDHFETLLNRILPRMISSFGSGISTRLVIWSAGCSTGEEPYTLAMVLAEFRERFPGLSFDYLILATDLSTRVLEKAKMGIYSDETSQQIPEALRRKYIMRSRDPRKDIVRVVPEIRNKVRFRQLNFIDGDFGMREPIDVVFFRNVQIYFDKETQYRIVSKIVDCMREGGYLFIGHSESLSNFQLPLETLVPTVYRKKMSGRGNEES